MKRTGAIVCLSLIFVMLSASLCFAGSGDLKLNKSYPADKAKETAIDNMGVKLYFDRDVSPSSKAVRAANAKECKILDSKGKEVPVLVIYNPKKKKEVMVLADARKKNLKIKSNTKYTIDIGKNFTANDGSTLASDHQISFTTMDQSKYSKINMLLMGVMVVAMIFFTVRSTKKQAEKEQQKKGKRETVNPYKVAKQTGKSVEEIVEKDQKKKAKEAEADAKKREREARKEEKDEEWSENKRVSGPQPISAAGSTYKTGRKAKADAAAAKKTAGTTRPKGQTGKQRNKGKKK